MSIDYNFDFLEDSNPTTRQNYRVIKCCLNCAYSYFKSNLGRCGWCGLGHRKARKRFIYTKRVKNWPRTHTTTLCDNWHPRSDGERLEWVTRCTSVVFNKDGTKVVE